MRCAFERLPSHIIELMNFCTRSLPKTESAGTSRRTTNPLRGIRHLLPLLFLSGFGPLGAVLGAPLLAVFDAGGVECSANHVIAHTGEILHAAAAHEHDGVLLQVMTYTRNIGCYFDTICQTGSSNFTQGGVGLLRRLRVNANADATLFRAALQRRRLRLCPDLIAAGTNQLCKRRHGSPSIELKFTSLSTSRKSAMQRVSGVHPKQGLSCDPGIPDKKPALLPAITTFHLVEAERVTRLCGAGAPFRPLFTPRSVVLCSGEEDLPFHQQGKTSLTKP